MGQFRAARDSVLIHPPLARGFDGVLQTPSDVGTFGVGAQRDCETSQFARRHAVLGWKLRRVIGAGGCNCVFT